MSKEKVHTIPDMASTSSKHQEVMAMGDDRFRLWQRNVIDEFKSLSEEEIKNRLQSTAFPYAILMENWINDFNISSCFRNANAFNAKEVFYVGNKKIDKRGMSGVHHYMDITFLPTISELLSLKEKYVFVGIDNIDGAAPLDTFVWENNSLMIFGSEGVGLTPEIIKMCDHMVYIKQYGSVRSLNAATASGIIMNDFINKFTV